MRLESGTLFDKYFSQFMAERSGLDDVGKTRCRELVASLSAALYAGHSCLPVDQEDEELLRESALVSVGEQTPLVLYRHNLYVHRYYHYEQRLALEICRKSCEIRHPQIEESLLDTQFLPRGKTETETEIDDQREAARLALSRALAIISGGPGTGKTTTVVKILALLLELEGDSLSIGLAAPTGKAAKRLSESIGASLEQLQLNQTIRSRLNIEAQTIHRLLGVRRHSPRFRHDHSNPIQYDIVVVDESSMIDLALMSKLVNSLRQDARLILLGDRDQLASVESGSVLADLIRSLPQNTVELRKTFRFDADIKALAAAINSGNVDQGWRLLHDTGRANISVVRQLSSTGLGERYRLCMEAAVGFAGTGIDAIFRRLQRFQILCATHYGRRGVDAVNRLVERELSAHGFECRTGQWYVGRPVLIGRNDYGLKLFNGDVGICLRDPKSGDPKVWFEQSDGSIRGFTPSLLPVCETAWAMTIHKSQGSEYDEVMVVLPEEDSPILTRELLYTGVTRAKKNVDLLVDKEVLTLALGRRIRRQSGLAWMLQDFG